MNETSLLALVTGSILISQSFYEALDVKLGAVRRSRSPGRHYLLIDEFGHFFACFEVLLANIGFFIEHFVEGREGDILYFYYFVQVVNFILLLPHPQSILYSIKTDTFSHLG